MKSRAFSRIVLSLFALSLTSLFAQETKVAIINIQDAITRTQEGQGLIKELEAKYKPKSQQIEAMQGEVSDLRNQLNKGQNTMSEDARRELSRQIEKKERDAQRSFEDARAEFNQEQQRIFNEVGGKLMTTIDKYAKEKGFSIVLDISSPQSPVLYAVNEVNITNDIITAYDGSSAAAGGGESSGAGAAGKPAQ